MSGWYPGITDRQSIGCTRVHPVPLQHIQQLDRRPVHLILAREVS
jgi:hypothetical protein